MPVVPPADAHNCRLRTSHYRAGMLFSLNMSTYCSLRENPKPVVHFLRKFAKYQNDQFPQLVNFAFQCRKAGLVKILLLLIKFNFAITHKSIVQAHIVWTTQADKNRQNRTLQEDVGPPTVGGRTTGLRTHS